MLQTLRGKIANITPLTLDKTLTLEGASADAKAVGDAIAKAKNEANAQTKNHTDSTTNPHKVTAEQVGLGNVDNTSDADKPVSTAQAKAIEDSANALRGEKAETKTYLGVFAASDWSESAPYTQEIAVNGILGSDNPLVDIDLSEVEDVLRVIEGWSYIGRCTVNEDNKVVAYCYQEAPAVDLPVMFKVVR